MYTTKKLIAVILSAIMLLGLCACGNNGSTSETTEDLQSSSPIGTILVSVGAEFQIGYNAKGSATNITSTNDAGHTAVAAMTDAAGQDCSYALCSLLDAASAGNLFGNTKTLVIRLSLDSQSPYEGFLEKISSDAQTKCDELKSGLAVKLITDAELTEEGFINLATAKELAAKYANLEDVSSLEGAGDPVKGAYAFTFDMFGDTETVIVDANTGHVSLDGEVLHEEDPDTEQDTSPDPTETSEEDYLEEEDEEAFLETEEDEEEID